MLAGGSENMAEKPADPNTGTGAATRVLIVDTAAATETQARAALQEIGGDWFVERVGTGQEALALLKAKPFSLVLTDLHLPDQDGLELVKTVVKKFPTTPVVLLTEQGSDDLAFKALKCGATNYVPKRVLAQELPATFESVLAAAETTRRRQRLMRCMNQNEVSFVIDNDATLVSHIVALFQDNLSAMGLVDDAMVIRIGIALEEAILNAIYHGNLEVSSELRRDGDKPYRDMIELRRKTQPYMSRQVHIHAKLTRDRAVYTIRDEGPGFDPTGLPDPTDPMNLESTSGRGLLLIRTFMDEVRHNSQGNEITLVKNRDPKMNERH